MPTGLNVDRSQLFFFERNADSEHEQESNQTKRPDGAIQKHGRRNI